MRNQNKNKNKSLKAKTVVISPQFKQLANFDTCMCASMYIFVFMLLNTELKWRRELSKWRIFCAIYDIPLQMAYWTGGYFFLLRKRNSCIFWQTNYLSINLCAIVDWNIKFIQVYEVWCKWFVPVILSSSEKKY